MTMYSVTQRNSGPMQTVTNLLNGVCRSPGTSGSVFCVWGVFGTASHSHRVSGADLLSNRLQNTTSAQENRQDRGEHQRHERQRLGLGQ